MIKTQIQIFTINIHYKKKNFFKSRVWFHWSLLIIQYALSYPHTSPPIYDKSIRHCILLDPQALSSKEMLLAL